MNQVENYKRGRVAIFYPSPNLGAFQPLLDASTLLADSGYLVEIYTLTHPLHPLLVLNNPGIVINTECADIFIDGGVEIPKLIYGKDGSFIRRGGKLFHWVGRIFHWFVTTFYRPIVRNRFTGIFRKNHKILPYICFFGMNRHGQGLIEASTYAEKLNIPLINWSLELSFMTELQTKKLQIRKKREIDCSRNAAFCIIQDEWRGKAYAEENGIPFSEMIFVPNAPMGLARRKPDNSFRKQLGIHDNKKIILCTGNIGFQTMNLEIIEAVNNLPDDFILVMQSRQRPSPKFDYSSQMVLRANPEKVKLLFEPVSTENYRTLVDNADVGICFYRACSYELPNVYSKNMDLIGLSSGKLSDYLFSGLPIIVNDVIGPKELVDSKNCGRWVKNPRDIEKALIEIFSNYEYYSKNAISCFNEKLELRKYFQPVIERITSFHNSY